MPLNVKIMTLLFASLLSLLTSTTALTTTHPQLPTKDLELGIGTFAHPSSQACPRFRYWLPDASVSHLIVNSDIAASGKIGAGGVEFLPFYSYGGDLGGIPAGSDWERYGFGTKAYRDIFVDALKTHAENGLRMDFPLGPNQGQGVPAEYGDEGLQWDLVSFTERVPASGVFEGVVPGWDYGEAHGELVALTSALVLSEQNRSQSTQDLGGPTVHNWTQYVLAHESLQEHTMEVDSGRVKLTFPSRQHGDNYYRVFAFYQKLSHHKNVEFESESGGDGSIFANGSFAVDHHSARGAQTLIEFWEKYMLDNEVLDLLKQAGNYVWEDSIEIVSNITWTPSLPTLFMKKHGYSIKPYLPLLTFKQNTDMAQRDTIGAFEAILNTPCNGTGFVNDYRSSLEDGYNQYINTIKTWVNQRLGLQYSNQPAYGLPQDMTAAIAHVDVPEYESLSFQNSIDAYRQFIGTAHLAGKKIISNELGAVVLKAYSYTISDLLDTVHRAIIGGTNQIILHGQTFSGEWFGTTWPGFTPFQYLFSELYSPKQPAWENGFAAVMGYISRLQFVHRQGTPRTDVAVFNRVSRTETGFPRVYESLDLEEAGYSYSYISPLSFSLPQAYVENRLLAPDGSGYKALVVLSTQEVTVSDVKQLQKYAQHGLPIILAGGRPQHRPAGASCTNESLDRVLDELQRTKNVYIVPEGHVAPLLSKMNIHPRASVTSKPRLGTVYTTWREDLENNISYAFLYNSANISMAGNATFATNGTPYILDAWTGKRQRIFTFARSKDNHNQTTSIPIQLHAGETMLVAFDLGKAQSQSPLTQSCHFTSLSGPVLGVTQSEHSTSLTVQLRQAGNQDDMKAATATLANGSTVILTSEHQSTDRKPIPLTAWTLTAEHWDAPSNISNAETIAWKHNTTHQLDKPTSWLDIPALQNASGVGYYTSEFIWSGGKDEGAYIHFSEITHTLQVSINDNPIDPFDHARGMADISPHLVPGKNKVLVVEPTTMWNNIRRLAAEGVIRESGGVPMGLEMVRRAPEGFPLVEGGLIGNVSVIPFVQVRVDC